MDMQLKLELLLDGGMKSICDLFDRFDNRQVDNIMKIITI
jgi:hypothetical protein